MLPPGITGRSIRSPLAGRAWDLDDGRNHIIQSQVMYGFVHNANQFGQSFCIAATFIDPSISAMGLLAGL
jgi:hypothetical protein